MAKTDHLDPGHLLKNICLILISFACLPLTMPIFLCLCFLSFCLGPNQTASRDRSTRDPIQNGDKITVLITGVSMQKGLTLARLFHFYGLRRPGAPKIRVVGADFSSLAMGAVSKSVARFYKLSPPCAEDDGPYVLSLLRVIRHEQVDLWVSCSGVASAVEDGVARDTIARATAGRCKCVQFGELDTAMLHEKGTFMEAVTKAGLPVPKTYVVTDTSQVDAALADHYGTESKFIIKPLGVVDKFRADMTKLPLATRQATQKHVARIPISRGDPFILQEFIDGKEYCTHAVVLKGRVTAFVACESASVLMHYVALPEDSPLTQAMLSFTTRMAEWAQREAEGRGDGSEFTGHMSFDFLVRRFDEAKRDGEVKIWPIECNPRTHTAVVLFDGDAGVKMIDAYIKYVQEGLAEGNGAVHDGDESKPLAHGLVYGAARHRYYWLPHDLVTFVMLPLYRALIAWSPLRDHNATRRSLAADIAGHLKTFLTHFGSPTWRDASLELWDPIPAWWLWHVYWPAKFLECLWQGHRWSEVNVSTGKVFGA